MTVIDGSSRGGSAAGQSPGIKQARLK